MLREVNTVMVDPSNQIQEFQVGQMKGTFQAWKHGVTIFGLHRLGNIDDLLFALKYLKDAYGAIRVINVDRNSLELSFWSRLFNRGLIDSIGDRNNENVEAIDTDFRQKVVNG